MISLKEFHTRVVSCSSTQNRVVPGPAHRPDVRWNVCMCVAAAAAAIIIITNQVRYLNPPLYTDLSQCSCFPFFFFFLSSLNAGLEFMTPWSRPELRFRVGQSTDWATRRPVISLFKTEIYLSGTKMTHSPRYTGQLPHNINLAVQSKQILIRIVAFQWEVG